MVFWLRREPSSNKTPLPVSTTEWMASDSMAELPVKAAAVNLVAAIARLPAMAAITAVRDSLFTRPNIANQLAREKAYLRVFVLVASESRRKLGAIVVR